MKVRVPREAGLAQFFLKPVGRVLIVVFALSTLLGLGVFTYYYVKYSRLIDQKLTAGPFANTAKIFAAPRSVYLGDAVAPADIAAELRRTGYNEARGNPVGYFQLHSDSVEIFPGPESYFDQEAGLIKFAGGRISGSSAVNTYGGTYSTGSGGAFAVGQLASTEMAGPEPAMRAEGAYITLLQQARSCKLAGDTLTLFDGNGNESLTFARATL